MQQPVADCVGNCVQKKSEDREQGDTGPYAFRIEGQLRLHRYETEPPVGREHFARHHQYESDLQ
ncbi:MULTISPECIES: hypothetical protein, partial [unclassified Mesorhizobium]|uniref:hypothetical protein n=1 Tax=unclassified Mesorhizobium TaxID=325217 RepID=UPI0030150625